MTKNALVIGANGGIGNEVLRQLVQDEHYETVFSVARSALVGNHANNSKVQHKSMDTADEGEVKSYVDELRSAGKKLDLVICTTGILHQKGEGETPLKPEKRLEDMNSAQLAEYFRINSILPAIWLQHLVKVVAKEKAAIVFLSARVGSITDNSLGGWYGYRASKAALNMLLKTASIEYKRRAANTSLMCYHPGTVDTGLSKPFQANVKPEKLFTPEFTVSQLLSITAELDAEESPFYLDWQGHTIPW
ncbi:SDR family NAD(P)-dependent oxidoreductase [Glaciecola sp. MH2013]|uniref:SDR family NAD(P)-dependent oxidoreductase n=1 Tax=Glaciecola sp. MH2013 TaxID=2785524 RepID=UPI0018A11819|nr:SDR family NAD(P)-dependent oxidoreductase [Glaciecola sp. MH2013]MBF7074990.1 SDR family NAD(P)-dependent oxidoreductase [Glaciecola sp. MH2013]